VKTNQLLWLIAGILFWNLVVQLAL